VAAGTVRLSPFAQDVIPYDWGVRHE